MFQEHNMAGGGIVAFDEGGHVPRYAGNTDGSLVSSAPSGLLGRLGLTESDYVRSQRQLVEMEARLKNMVPGTGPYEALKQSILDLRSENRNKYTNQPSISKKFSTDQNIPVSAASTAPSADYSGVGAFSPDASIGARGTPTAAVSADKSDTTTDKPQATPTVPGLPNMSFGFKPLTSMYDTPEAAARIAELRTPVPIEQSRAEFAGEKPTVESSVGNVKDFQKAFGVNEDVYKNQEERLKSQEGKLSEQKQTAGWMALAQAGLSAAAGSSPYALKNIAEGGVRGLSEYNNAMDKLQDREDKLNTARFNLEDAQNKFRQTGSATALQQYNSALNDYKSANRSYTQMEHNAATTAKSLDASMFSAEQSERGATQRGNLQATQSAQGLGLQYAQLRQTAAHNQAMLNMYDKKIEASDRATAARLYQVKANYLAKIKNSTAYQDFIAELNKKYAKTQGSSNPNYQRDLQMYINGELAPLLENKINELGLAQPAESLLQG
jgi:hypothetical protein